MTFLSDIWKPFFPTTAPASKVARQDNTIKLVRSELEKIRKHHNDVSSLFIEMRDKALNQKAKKIQDLADSLKHGLRHEVVLLLKFRDLLTKLKVKIEFIEQFYGSLSNDTIDEINRVSSKELIEDIVTFYPTQGGMNNSPRYQILRKIYTNLAEIIEQLTKQFEPR